MENCIPKLEKGQNVNKYAEETAVELDGEMSLDAKLIRKFITQQVAAAISKKTKQYEKKIKKRRKVERMECWESRKKTEQGAAHAPPRKIKNRRLIQQQKL